MIRFILNNLEVSTDLPAGTVLLDYVRYDQHLTGTKVGCREGDCGACTVLIGEMVANQLRYRSYTSCLTPLGNVTGKHVLTIEGLNQDGLNPIQNAMVEESATQCGFCTPGFVVSLAGFCLSNQAPSPANAIAAIDGNICRCTGYKSIERAAGRVTKLLAERQSANPILFAIQNNILPNYLTQIEARLRGLAAAKGSNGTTAGAGQVIGGGTDLYVQKHDEMTAAALDFLLPQPALKTITRRNKTCVIGPAATVTDLAESPLILELFPDFARYVRLVSSTPIRNMATIAGNLVNASPIGDFTIMLLALNASVTLSGGAATREVPLREFYRGYKTLNKAPEEVISQITFPLPGPGAHFHFEKVSKRTHLDIASVNTAICLQLSGNTIAAVSISAGGVGPVPAFLPRTSAFLTGKAMRGATLKAAQLVAQSEISPISDARGTETYKRLLLNQLILAHFLQLVPALEEEIPVPEMGQ